MKKPECLNPIEAEFRNPPGKQTNARQTVIKLHPSTSCINAVPGAKKRPEMESCLSFDISVVFCLGGTYRSTSSMRLRHARSGERFAQSSSRAAGSLYIAAPKPNCHMRLCGIRLSMARISSSIRNASDVLLFVIADAEYLSSSCRSTREYQLLNGQG